LLELIACGTVSGDTALALDLWDAKAVVKQSRRSGAERQLNVGIPTPSRTIRSRLRSRSLELLVEVVEDFAEALAVYQNAAEAPSQW
jgi:hypothetical protein